MREQWEAFWLRVGDWAHEALWPFRALADQFGYAPSDIQIWCLICVVFLGALVVPETYGDLVLMRRRAYTTGKVVRLDTSGDGPDTPVIEFTDRAGKRQRFHSGLAVNSTTATVGAEVAVIYDPVNPNRAREARRTLTMALGTIVWYGTIAFLIAFVIWGE
ncbi:hypothetical protein MesoLjLc_32140 [Mesorhizobium sp. L-8-10]|uniref:DUF3592 domain-containing protein n=1 Tax=Mesorhizobium sp. L-8-10 TaxID=2744523 RepID=UPI001926E617|nr:DUF3592 domain-containing protein [Mesorhizobium sp. L-8-10]BCH31284.1 hypothetical protein MesoLjLc_32140 [Mesorhizobium sp. L-8-10]